MKTLFVLEDKMYLPSLLVAILPPTLFPKLYGNDSRVSEFELAGLIVIATRPAAKAVGIRSLRLRDLILDWLIIEL
jgi:hypothetical protein